MYTCRQIAQFLDLYFDGELDDQRRLMVEAHLRNCHPCRELLRFREQERELVRSLAPAPALSPGFTGLVMDNLTGLKTGLKKAPSRQEGFFPLRLYAGRLFNRPWFAPALASLVLLVALAWGVSIYRLHPFTGNRKLAAMTSQQAGPSKLSLPGNTALGTASGKTAAGGPGKNGPANGAAPIPAPAGSSGTGASNPVKPDTLPGSQKQESLTAAPASQPKSLTALEQAGYTLFTPGYLPSGFAFETYSFETYSVAPGEGANNQQGPPNAGNSGLLLSYLNAQSGEWITLSIQPVSGSVPNTGQNGTPVGGQQPAAPSGQNVASPAAGSQPAAGNQITWPAQKNGNNFSLSLSGSIPYSELQRVAASVK